MEATPEGLAAAAAAREALKAKKRSLEVWRQGGGLLSLCSG